MASKKKRKKKTSAMMEHSYETTADLAFHLPLTHVVQQRVCVCLWRAVFEREWRSAAIVFMQQSKVESLGRRD